MNSETIFYIIIAGAVSLALAIFMYGYKSKQEGKIRWIFGLLRFLTLFALLILIINPKFESETYTIEKPKLPVLIDNSASVSILEQNQKTQVFLNTLKEDTRLNDKFDIAYFTFGSDFKQSDSLSFDEKNTNISKALSETHQIYKNQNAPIVLITDGNQTLGSDYEFASLNYKNAIYPVILGDSTKYTDLKIEQLNTNRYAFLKNHFPVETILTYSGSGSVQTHFEVYQGGSVVFREAVSFSENETSKTINFMLPAERVGLQRYTAQLLPLENEKNKTNNSKHFAVEVIDQATHVLIVRNVSHPDVGAIKNAIITNEQREVDIKKPSEALSVLNDYHLIILYQPDRSFTAVFNEIEKLGKNTWTITGLHTDWNFLNNAQKNFIKRATNSEDLVQASLNSGYASFSVEDLGFDDFPPLYTKFGTLTMNGDFQTMLNQTVNGISNDNPLLATIESDVRRYALWDGDGLWRWRARSFLNEGSFQNFDDFVGNLVQYLASSKRRSRLEVASETFYYNNNPIKISAQYFDKNYVFDSRASLHIKVKNTETEKVDDFPMLLRNNYFEVDLASLPAGEYSYTISEATEAISKSGNFTIIEFNVEQQFLNADISKLARVAKNSGGQEYFVNESEKLIDDLLQNSNYQNVQKAERKTIPLIDWKYLLGIIASLLAIEWFIRKYNGLI